MITLINYDYYSFARPIFNYSSLVSELATLYRLTHTTEQLDKYFSVLIIPNRNNLPVVVWLNRSNDLSVRRVLSPRAPGEYYKAPGWSWPVSHARLLSLGPVCCTSSQPTKCWLNVVLPTHQHLSQWLKFVFIKSLCKDVCLLNIGVNSLNVDSSIVLQSVVDVWFEEMILDSYVLGLQWVSWSGSHGQCPVVVFKHGGFNGGASVLQLQP